MKKMILSVVMVFATIIVFGQGIVPEPAEKTKKTGINTPRDFSIDCQIQQIVPTVRGAALNLVEVTEFGDYNDVEAYQEGNQNYIEVLQGHGYPGTNSDFNDVYIEQHGHRNHSEVWQYGHYNDGFIEQRGRMNFAQQWVGNNRSHFNKAEVNQRGQMNTSYQRQINSNNWAYVEQSPGEYGRFGGYNYAEQYQVSGNNVVEYNGILRNFAFIDQEGKLNKAKQTQEGNRNYADSYQRGQNNTSVEDQFSGNYGSRIGGTNSSFVIQIGDWNEACVTQDASFGGNNYSDIFQNGNYNEAMVHQTSALGLDNAAWISQNGNYNQVKVTQTGGHVHY